MVRCLRSKMIFGHVVPYKGVGEDQFVVGLVVADIVWLGHTKMISNPTMSKPCRPPLNRP